MIEDVSGVLIAGGRSRRMGQDKRFMRVGGESVFDRTLSLLRGTFVENIVVLAEPIEMLDVQACPVVYDVVPNAGSLGGLYTGLTAVSRPKIFAVACDMPFLDPEAILAMLSHRESADVVVARLSGRLQPMHTVYSKRCLPFLQAMAERKELKIQKLFEQQALRVTVLGEDDLRAFGPGFRSFQNVNTPDDLALAESPPAVQP
ncbi:MAG TPA: molybdenum cofactor guanylyltransferase [Nitrospira sp.]|nr:molybdenum cofactor guanylyltransferase [Nitrospira sp. NTP1]HQR13706.1 molybdenum cofactor guanylyltransferase [Nitrospira sp.]